MISYEKLEQKLREKHINKSDLGALTGLSSNVILQTLREEKAHQISGGLYHEL